ncbi:O-antigen ligase family protein [Rubripirellula reticaptiva]|nr:O-antigen ligase family protein [Rubripirellula reticaptiva]
MLQLITYITIAIAIFLAYKSKERMGYALGLMWSMYAWEQLVQQGNAFLLQRGSLINIGLTLLAILAILFAYPRGELRHFRFQPPHLCVIGLLSLAVASSLWTISPKDTEEQLRLMAPYLFAFVLVCPFLAQNPRAIKDAINVTIYFGGLVLLGLLFSKIGSRGVILTRVGGVNVEGNPLATASYAGIVAICTGFSVYNDRTNKALLLLKLAIVALALWTVVRSGSRGQMVALVVSTLLMLPLTARLAVRRSTIMPLLTIAIFCGAAIWAIDHYDLSARWRWVSINGAREGRFQMVIRLLEVWASGGPFTWIGGLGSSSSFRIVGFYPHCVPPEVLAELGLVGFALLVMFVVGVTNRGLAFLKSTSIDPSTRLLIGTLFTMFFFDALLSLKQGSFLGSPFFLCHGISIALACSTAHLYKHDDVVNLPKRMGGTRRARLANTATSGDAAR